MPVLDQNLLTLERTTSAPGSSWSAERSALAADALLLSGYLRLRVHGESMLPSLWPGDVVEIANCSPEDLRPGDIVLARRDDRLFLHRLVASCTSSGFLLRGDCVPASDPRFPPEALLGRLVRGADKGAGNLALSRALSRALGLLFCYCSVARRFALKLHHRRTAPATEFRSAGTL